ncbi:MAG: arsenate reductase ArsC [Candidatus Omnitrophica bacterium]|nr:arsenate reductase ArsC [Candidatus Omnitrophota bacterium]MCM8823503.1 arsenate reductase ArsC [Candidatus Omnitrophota bacterium]MCM8826649.1 arsenate reductase ArsC [Candidatus Omnitrophota bacterium]
MSKKKVLFVCIENACRSQMAEGWAKFFGKDSIDVYSAGSKPALQVDPKAIEVMKEKGIDISLQSPKSFKDLPVKDFDYVITLGCKEICPFLPANEHIEWKIDDPKGKSIDFFRKVRDDIEERVEKLIKEIS